MLKERISNTDKIYSDSLIQTGLGYDTVLKDLQKVIDIINSSSELNNVLTNPSINNDKKNDIIESVFKLQVDDKIVNFLKILTDKNKFKELKAIYASYMQTVDKMQNIKRTDIISAINLSDEWKNKITEKLQQKFNKKVIPNWITDNEIIGGLVIRTDDDIIDGSLKNKLERLSKV